MDQIDLNILIAWGAIARNYKKGEAIFWEGEPARYYYQIQSGLTKIFNINDEGREFTQGIYESGESFGEPPLFFQGEYVASAIAMTDSTIYRLPDNLFLQLLSEHAEIQKGFNELFAKRLHNKAFMARETINSSESRILAFLEKTKLASGDVTDKVIIPFTRQEIANSTGLRVETVIRTLGRMVKKDIVEIKRRKLYY